MYRVLRRYKCDNIIKYVSFPVSQKLKNSSRNFEKALIFAKDYNKFECNLIRAKTKVKELILCNNFKFFITLTFKPEYDRYNLDYIRKLVTQCIRDTRKSFLDLDLFYLLIPEQHKNGAWHLHGVLSSDFSNFLYVNNYGFNNLSIFDKFGFNSCSDIINREKISSYCLKYITKDFAFREYGKHLYFASKGLKRPVKLNDVLYNNDFLDSQFWEFKSDFSYVSYFNKNIDFKTFLR